VSVEVKVDLSGYPKGMPVSVGGLPPVENGKSLTLSDEEEADFKARNGSTIKEFFDGNDEVTVGTGKSK
jgi:hypothetical protein